MKKITIITPCRNAEEFITETVVSILEQAALKSGRVELDYIICDGNSTDKTVEIAERLTQDFQHGTVRVISQPDTGMYDALSLGLKLAEGDFCAYLNAGDYYSKYAFDIILDLFEKDEVDWLTGFSAVYNDRSYLVQMLLPYRFRKRLFQTGCYGKWLLPPVQQESTFWRSKLNELLNFDELASYDCAGDYYLWKIFSEKYNLKIVTAYIGGFRHHIGQKSENLGEYFQEVSKIINGRTPNLIDFSVGLVDSLAWHMPDQFKKLLNSKGIYRFNDKKQDWE